MEATTKVHIATAVTDYMNGIHRLAREYGVQRLEVYGEAAYEEIDNPLFAVSFLVTYPEDYDYGPWLGRYTELSEALARLLSREIHLTMSTATFENPYRRSLVDETRQTIYASS